MDKNKEIWKELDIDVFGGLYKISNHGRCFSYNENKHIKSYDNGNGYMFFRLSNGTDHKNFYVHRLVGIYFIENKFSKEQINHINGIKSDNRVENLEWCTRSENQIHRYNVLNKHSKQKGNPLKNNFKKVALYDNENKIIETYESLRAASLGLNINYTNLSSILNNKRLSNINIAYV